MCETVNSAGSSAHDADTDLDNIWKDSLEYSLGIVGIFARSNDSE